MKGRHVLAVTAVVAAALTFSSISLVSAQARQSKNYYCTHRYIVGKQDLAAAPAAMMIQGSWRPTECADVRREPQRYFDYYDGIRLFRGYRPLCGLVLINRPAQWLAVYARPGTENRVLRSGFCTRYEGWRLVPASGVAKLVRSHL